MEDEGLKRKREENEQEAPAAKKKRDTAVETATPSAMKPNLYQALQRPHGQGMNPKSILMGIYGPRGEKIRHTVHQGSMKLPSTAIEISRDIQQACVDHTNTLPTTKFQLPVIDGVVRPTMDNQHHRAIIITEISASERPPPLPIQTMHGMIIPPQQPHEKWQTHARNWKLKLSSPAEVHEKLAASATTNTTEASPGVERIRGGGGGEQDVIMIDSDDNTTATSQPTAPGTTQGSEASAAAAFEPPKSPCKNTGETTTAPAVPPTADAPSSTQAAAPAPTPAAAPVTAGTAAAAASTTSSTTAPPTQTTSSGITAPTPATTASSSTTTTTTSAAALTKGKTKVPAVIPLPTVPNPQWEQQQPGPNDEMQSGEPKTSKPAWFSPNQVSDFERCMLPEWFNESAPHRTVDGYLQARNKILEISQKLATRYVTATLIRRTVAGDAGSLLRLHDFLTTWSLINEDANNDSAPTPSGFRAQEGEDATSNKQGSSISNNKTIWNETAREELMEAVVDESKKKRLKTTDDESAADAIVDWEVVSKRVGNGASATDCEKIFLALPLEAAADKLKERSGSITPDVTSSETANANATDQDKTVASVRQDVLKELVEGASPQVVKAATDAALAATDNVAEAQKAGLLALVASEAATKARQEEDTVSRLLTELQEQRLQKLENRMALLDDIEGVLEAERVALELERRDLYTARCRHWFGGAS